MVKQLVNLGRTNLATINVRPCFATENRRKIFPSRRSSVFSNFQ